MGQEANIQQSEIQVTSTQVVSSSSLQVGSEGRVALQTVQGIVKSKNAKQGVRCLILLDSGSQKSFVASDLTRLLDGEPTQKEWLEINAFGKQGKTSQCNAFEVKVEPLSGVSGVKMEVSEDRTSAKIANFHQEIVKTECTHLKGLWFSDIANEDVLEVDILVGTYNLWQIQRDGIKGGGGGELGYSVAIETIFDWTISGKLSGPRDHHADVNLVLDTTGEKVDSELKRLWDLEALGICDTKHVYEDLVEEKDIQ